MSSANRDTFQVGVCGGGGVGKSCITVRFVLSYVFCYFLFFAFSFFNRFNRFNSSKKLTTKRFTIVILFSSKHNNEKTLEQTHV